MPKPNENDNVYYRKVKMVEFGTKIPNEVLRITVEKLRRANMDDKLIVDQLIKFDALAEKGELLDYINRLKMKKNG